MCARKLGKLKEAIKMFREVSVYVTSFFDRAYRYDIGGTIHSVLTPSSVISVPTHSLRPPAFLLPLQ